MGRPPTWNVPDGENGNLHRDRDLAGGRKECSESQAGRVALGLAQRATRDNATRLSLSPLREEKLAVRDVLEAGKEDLLEGQDLAGRHEESSEY